VLDRHRHRGRGTSFVAREIQIEGAVKCSINAGAFFSCLGKSCSERVCMVRAPPASTPSTLRRGLEGATGEHASSTTKCVATRHQKLLFPQSFSPRCCTVQYSNVSREERRLTRRSLETLVGKHHSPMSGKDRKKSSMLQSA
jgi:hypothetical protein